MLSGRDSFPRPRSCRWDVDGLQLAGLAWGPEGGTRVLALHGWMDHAASFQELAPLLTRCHVVALDLSGHGMSAHRAAHATYNIWDDLPQIAGVLEQLGWDNCVFLGHSRGAIIATLFAATLPEKVRALIALDSILPEPAAPDSFVKTLRSFVVEDRTQKSRPDRVFGTRRDYIERRRAQGNSLSVANALADRALEELPEGFRMRGDPRLFASSAVRLTLSHIETVLRSLECPVLNIWAKDSADSIPANLEPILVRCKEWVKDYRALELPGDHHFHLDPEIAADISRLTLDFIAEAVFPLEQDGAPRLRTH